MTFFSYSVTVF